MNPEIVDLIGERRKAKANERKYKELDKQIKKRCNEAKENWINTQCEEIEGNNGIDIKTVHQKRRDVTGKKSSVKIGCLRLRDGNILMEKEHILNTWLEYITELYHDDRGPPPIINNEDEGPLILEDEVQKALTKMKGKAAGPDDIPSEMIAALNEIGIKEVTEFLNIIYAAGKIPADMKKSVYIAIPKKQGTVECEQHRTISLMSHLTKVMLRVLMNRMRNKILPELPEI